MRRGLVATVLLCLGGAALVLLATSRAWLSFEMDRGAPLPPRVVEITGSTLAPGARALALVGLAAAAAILAVRGRARVLVGALVAVSGVGIVAAVAYALNDPHGVLSRTRAVGSGDPPGPWGGAWPYVAVLGGLLLFGAGVLTVVRGRSWTGLGARYDAPAAAKEPSLWEALDRGDDPTA